MLSSVHLLCLQFIKFSIVWKVLFYFVLKIVDGVASIDVRRKFIAALAPLFGRPVEADPVRILVYSLLHGWIKQKADLSLLCLPGLLQKGNISGFLWSVYVFGRISIPIYRRTLIPLIKFNNLVILLSIRCLLKWLGIFMWHVMLCLHYLGCPSDLCGRVFCLYFSPFFLTCWSISTDTVVPSTLCQHTPILSGFTC